MNFIARPLDLVIIGRSILSSYGNPTAGLYRGLINELAQRGHRTTFLEPFDPVMNAHRDMLRSPYCEVWTYADTDQLIDNYYAAIKSADIVMLGNGVPDADRIAEWIANTARGVTVYYDTNLARTRQALEEDRGDNDCLSCRTVSNFHLFLSTTGGPALEQLAYKHGIDRARPLYASIDPYSYYRTDAEKTYDLGFIGNHHAGREELLNRYLLAPARITPNRRFALAGDGYSVDYDWPPNLVRLEHLPEANHVDFYNRQRCTLFLCREDRRQLGFTPSRRLLAAAACGVPVLSDHWNGLEDFFELDREIFRVDEDHDVLDVLYHTDGAQLRRVGQAGRERVLRDHTTEVRTRQLLDYWEEVMD